MFIKYTNTCAARAPACPHTHTHTSSKSFVFNLLNFILQINKKECYLDICNYLLDITFDKDNHNIDIQCVKAILLSSMLHKIIQVSCDPSPYIMNIIETLNAEGTENTHSVILILISQTILICPPLFLKDILLLCKYIFYL